MIRKLLTVGIIGILSCSAFASEDAVDGVGDDKRDCKQENRGGDDDAEADGAESDG